MTTPTPPQGESERCRCVHPNHDGGRCTNAVYMHRFCGPCQTEGAIEMTEPIPESGEERGADELPATVVPSITDDEAEVWLFGAVHIDSFAIADEAFALRDLLNCEAAAWPPYAERDEQMRRWRTFIEELLREKDARDAEIARLREENERLRYETKHPRVKCVCTCPVCMDCERFDEERAAAKELGGRQ